MQFLEIDESQQDRHVALKLRCIIVLGKKHQNSFYLYPLASKVRHCFGLCIFICNYLCLLLSENVSSNLTLSKNPEVIS